MVYSKLLFKKVKFDFSTIVIVTKKLNNKLRKTCNCNNIVNLKLISSINKFNIY